MKVLVKNPPKQSLRPLREKEIQEHLYGQYRAGTIPAVGDLETRIKEVISHPNAAFMKRESNQVARNLLKTVYEKIKAPVLSLAKSIPWPFVAVVAGAFLTAILAVQVISHWIGGLQAQWERKRVENILLKVQEPDERESVETVATNIPPVSRKAVSVESAFSATDQTSGLTPAEDSTGPAAEKKRLYAVQICTYQKEEDAQKLVGVLKAAQFSAFYLRMTSRNNHIPFYVVFLGQHESFVAAQAMLSDFKKTEFFKNFSDSFVRSL